MLPNPQSAEPRLQCSYSEDQKETGKQLFFFCVCDICQNQTQKI